MVAALRHRSAERGRGDPCGAIGAHNPATFLPSRLLTTPYRCSTERDHEAELGEAIRRRDATIDKVQEANMSLQVRFV